MAMETPLEACMRMVQAAADQIRLAGPTAEQQQQLQHIDHLLGVFQDMDASSSEDSSSSPASYETSPSGSSSGWMTCELMQLVRQQPHQMEVLAT
jgi:hypothetical protein